MPSGGAHEIRRERPRESSTLLCGLLTVNVTSSSRLAPRLSPAAPHRRLLAGAALRRLGFLFIGVVVAFVLGLVVVLVVRLVLVLLGLRLLVLLLGRAPRRSPRPRARRRRRRPLARRAPRPQAEARLPRSPRPPRRRRRSCRPRRNVPRASPAGSGLRVRRPPGRRVDHVTAPIASALAGGEPTLLAGLVAFVLDGGVCSAAIATRWRSTAIRYPPSSTGRFMSAQRSC